MAKINLVLGESGSGKSRSILNLPPKMTFIINPAGEQKMLPFRGAETKYPEFNFKTKKGNMLTSSNVEDILNVLEFINLKRPEIKFIIIDDNQYLGLFTFVDRMAEKDWAKFNTITENTIKLIRKLAKYRKDLMIFIMNHVENGSSVEGKELIQAKNMGKFIKDRLTYEGLFTVVLLCDKEEGDDGDSIRHFFWTRRLHATVKTPEGMFEDQKIDNDLFEVAKKIRDYYK